MEPLEQHIQNTRHELERSVIGAMMANPSTIEPVCALAKPEDFSAQVHQDLYRIIRACSRAGLPTDAISIADAMSGTPPEGGWVAFCGAIASDSLGVFEAALDHAKRVARYGRRDRTLEIGAALMKALTDGDDFVAAADAAAMALVSVTADRGLEGLVSPEMSMPAYLDEVQQRMDNDGPQGIPTGLIDVDEMICGLRPGSLTMVAGRPGMGKTSFATTLLRNTMKLAGVGGSNVEGPLALFTLEMSRNEIYDRMVSGMGSIDLQRLRAGTLDDGEMDRFVTATGQLNRSRLLVSDKHSHTIEQVAASCRDAHVREPLSLIMVDYLQLAESAKGKNRQEEISNISRTLKRMAMDLSVPVVALSQLNRGVEARDNKRPRLSDLRESGSLEQDADTILMLYRHGHYHEEFVHQNVVECIITKQRNGPVGTVFLTWLPQVCSFANCDRDSAREYRMALTKKAAPGHEGL